MDKRHDAWQPPAGWDPTQPPPAKPSRWRRVVTKRPVWVLAVIAVATLGVGVAIGAADQPTPEAAPAMTVPGPTVTVPGPTVTKIVPGPTVTVKVPGPTVTKTVPGPTVTVTAAPAPSTSAPAPGTPSIEDGRVVITYCGIDSLGWMTAKVVITNTSTYQTHDYFVTVEFTNAAGQQIDTGLASADQLAPGQSTTAQEANSLHDANGVWPHCRVSKVDVY